MQDQDKLPVILIVDDEESTVRAMARCLKGTCRVVPAYSAEQGFEMLRRHHVEVVISDYKMPKMNGVEFLRRVRILYPDMVVMMSTGYADLEMLVKAVNDVGVLKFIMKPWELDDLNRKVSKGIAISIKLRMAQKKKSGMVTKNEESEEFMKELESKYPGITDIDTDDDGNILSGF